MPDLKQHDNGALSIYDDVAGKSLFTIGGAATPAAGGVSHSHRASNFIKLTLGSSPGTGGVLAWASPFPEDVVVGKTIVKIEAASTGTLKIGTGASSTAYGDNLIDSLSTSATGVFDNITDKGTNGRSRQLLSAGSYITCTQQLTPNTLSGFVFLEILRP